MEDTILTVDISQFKTFFPTKSDKQLGDDFFIAEIRYSDELKKLNYPCRFDGYMALFCLKGNITLDMNLNTYKLEENSLLLSVPGYILRASFDKEENGDNKDMRFIFVALSRSFMSSIHLDFNKLFYDGLTLFENPCIRLSNDEVHLFGEYLHLALAILDTDVAFRKEAIASIFSSLTYVLGGLWSHRLQQAKSATKVQSARAKMVFEQFLKLVTEHHNTRRDMSFYAERLCLTPKYLSKLVKSVSGQSAPDWIDSFVILEAKNMLKYSDSSIKEIVFKLNFPNQSVFYKFFKAHTGMTPSEYRNS